MLFPLLTGLFSGLPRQRKHALLITSQAAVGELHTSKDDLDLSCSPIGLTIAELKNSSRVSLADRWRSLYGSDPPKGVGQRFLIGAIAFELQMRQTGQSTSRLRRHLEKQAKQLSTSAPEAVSAARRLKSGTRLVREWNGSTHSVDVVENGFLWNGARYRSLSAIARAITGTRWSGPRFFGLESGDST